uniref:Uncharacterized protein n=1 Tax=Anopheles culicifacies TaxID=139723 RepID=A0A182MAI6_9DIPT
METEANDASQPTPPVANGEETSNPMPPPASGGAGGGSGIQPPKVRALPKPSGIRPPSANLHGGSTTSLASTSSQLTTASSAATGTATSTASTTRIGRLCMGHTPPKAGPPPPEPKPQSSTKSPRKLNNTFTVLCATQSHPNHGSFVRIGHEAKQRAKPK